MAKLGLNVIATDLTPEAIKNIEKYKKQFKLLNLKIIKSYAEEIPLLDKSVDYIVANAILDNKMHCTEFTDDEALMFLVNEAYQSEGEARLKIVRAKQSSVQLSTYFVGRMAHYRLRQEIQRELGDKFDLGRFHEAVLDHGSVPVKFLPGLVRKRLAIAR